MTIHHDKLAYGKLQPTSEELSEEEILKMLAEIEEGATARRRKKKIKIIKIYNKIRKKILDKNFSVYYYI